MTKTFALLSASLLAVACGDNRERPDANTRRDSSVDAQCSTCPPAPGLGVQLDRMGRPAINTALNRNFSNDATGRNASKNNYNVDANPANWPNAWTTLFGQSLAILDVLDGGIDGNGLCEIDEHGTGASNPPVSSVVSADCQAGQIGTAMGCGNQAAYTASDPLTPAAYGQLATILANDALYLDTSRGQCGLYLAVEFGVVTGLGNTTCGGRAPEDDVIDVTYSLTALGLKGFSTDGQFTPVFGDMVGKHTDYTAEFPFLGPPH